MVDPLGQCRPIRSFADCVDLANVMQQCGYDDDIGEAGIKLTNAPKTARGNRHAMFEQSPWFGMVEA